MNKKLGEFYSGEYSTPIWASIYSYQGKTFMSIFFTQPSSPRSETWYKDIEPHGFKVFTKGNYRYGYYYKVIISKPIRDMVDALKKLSDWSYGDYKMEFKYTIEEMYNKFVLESL